LYCEHFDPVTCQLPNSAGNVQVQLANDWGNQILRRNHVIELYGPAVRNG